MWEYGSVISASVVYSSSRDTHSKPIANQWQRLNIPQRNLQFRYIRRVQQRFKQAGHPIWNRQDRIHFEDESKLLILCDSGGSNGYRLRNWKLQLQLFADYYGIEVMVCHYPSGASKWNPIEHRLFSFISLNWAGQPLRTLNQMTALIRGTSTQTGLRVKACQLKGEYPTKVNVSDEEMAGLNLTPRKICPQWIYMLHPRT